MIEMLQLTEWTSGPASVLFIRPFALSLSMALAKFSLEGKVYIVNTDCRVLSVALASTIVKAGTKIVYCLALFHELTGDEFKSNRHFDSKGTNLGFTEGPECDRKIRIENSFDELVKTEEGLADLVNAAGCLAGSHDIE